MFNSYIKLPEGTFFASKNVKRNLLIDGFKTPITSVVALQQNSH